jgi:hypothetical protein
MKKRMTVINARFRLAMADLMLPEKALGSSPGQTVIPPNVRNYESSEEKSRLKQQRTARAADKRLGINGSNPCGRELRRL